MKKYFIFSVIVAITSAAMIGCSRGPKTVPVTGKVTYQGQPLKFGSVMFQPEKGRMAKGQIQPDGTFTLSTDGKEGAVPGMHKVGVTCFELQSPNPPATPPGQEPSNGRSFIPQKYNSPTGSGIAVEVTEDMKPVELNLQ